MQAVSQKCKMTKIDLPFRVVKTHSKRMKMQELSRTALSYDQEEAKLKAKSDNRTWY